MTRVEEKAIDAWAIYEYREHPKGLYHTCFVDGYKEGYEQAEKDALALLERLRADAEKRDLNIAAQCGYHIALDAVELLIKEGQR